jgi:methylenetetrahydrofolate dehydrogenase (NADP+)/methenyltetrahydrofolate cyclohydrolase
MCENVGFKSSLFRYDSSITESELMSEIIKLNQDDDIDGYIVQLPLPKHISVHKVIEAILPQKDVDGFHPINFGKMTQQLPCFIPATPKGIMQLLERYNIPTKGKHCVVIGRSNIVGTPMSILLSRNSNPGNCTVTLCHSHTENLKSFTLQADIIVAAIGIPNFVKGDMIKEGAVVIDVGMTRAEDKSKKSGFRLFGDVDFESASKVASYITPVPGGVGPMTIIGLLQNTLLASKKIVQS